MGLSGTDFRELPLEVLRADTTESGSLSPATQQAQRKRSSSLTYTQSPTDSIPKAWDRGEQEDHVMPVWHESSGIKGLESVGVHNCYPST